MRVVLDTNVLISGLLNATGKPAEVLSLILAGRIVPLIDNRVLLEYEAVLRRPKFQFPGDAIVSVLEFFRQAGEFVTPEPTAQRFTDTDDRKFYEVAISGAAEFLITGNTRHFPDDPIIVSPSEFLEHYD
mgnify:CR=1 FL=1|tara:strand:+ start:463 stop:852 length:390 start_codon:yes stop_codon:yes gene_type:complete